MQNEITSTITGRANIGAFTLLYGADGKYNFITCIDVLEDTEHTRDYDTMEDMLDALKLALAWCAAQ